MNDSASQNTYFNLGLNKKEFYYTLCVVLISIVFFGLVYKENVVRVTKTFEIIQLSFITIFSIAVLSALTVACLYAYQLFKSSSFLFIALCWIAHSFYKLFILGWDKTATAAERIQLVIVASIADLPLFLSGFTENEKKWWHPLIPILTILINVILYYSSLNYNTQIKILFFISPIISIAFLIWVFYSVSFRNILKINSKLVNYYGLTFLVLALFQTPYMLESFCQKEGAETYSLCANQMSIWYYTSYFTLTVYIINLFFVVSIVKEGLSNLYSTKAYAEEQLKRKGEFEELGYLTASIEHELRTPLAVFDNEIILLRRKYQNEGNIIKRLDSLERQRLRILAAADIINTLRSNREDIISQLRPISLKELIDRSIKDVKREFTKMSDEIYFHVNERSQGIQIECVAPLMEQAIVNILKNAIESILSATKKGEIKIEIYLEGKDKVVMSFQDSGVGFIVEDIEKLIKPDYTTKQENTGKPNRGIGLFVCSKIVRIHDGNLYFTNRETGGAIVLITLPRFISKKMRRNEED
jgi:signal transduction histidine kinase